MFICSKLGKSIMSSLTPQTISGASGCNSECLEIKSSMFAGSNPIFTVPQPKCRRGREGGLSLVFHSHRWASVGIVLSTNQSAL